MEAVVSVEGSTVYVNGMDLGKVLISYFLRGHESSLGIMKVTFDCIEPYDSATDVPF
jgi:hypothetical protein